MIAPPREGSLHNQLSQWQEQGAYQVNVPAHEGPSAHQAKLVLNYGQVCLRQSEGKKTRPQPSELPTWIVEVKELPERVINQEKPIHWILLSSHRIDNLEKALQIVDY